MNPLFTKILSRDEFKDDPPVLVDIGSSGGLNKAWLPIAKHSVCVAFDADERELACVEEEGGRYKKLYLYKALATPGSDGKSQFNLTKNPFCSSLLKPRAAQLEDWAFAEQFEVVDVIERPAISLTTVLKERGLRRIDWFKTDSQGMDLRLFSSLDASVRKGVLAAEFEPGIIDAYDGEDKMHAVLSAMSGEEFWLADMRMKGTQRIRGDILDSLPRHERRLIHHCVRPSPCWCELLFMNTFRHADTSRDFLLGWCFAMMNGQIGFALQLAVDGSKTTGDGVFKELERYARRNLRLRMLVSPFRHLWGKLGGKTWG